MIYVIYGSILDGEIDSLLIYKNICINGLAWDVYLGENRQWCHLGNENCTILPYFLQLLGRAEVQMFSNYDIT